MMPNYFIYTLWRIYRRIIIFTGAYIRDFENKRHYERIKNSKGEIGINVKFGKDVIISGVNKIKIGDNVHIGSGCFIRAEGGLIIKNNVIISRNVIIYTNSHNYSGDLLPFDNTFINKPVIINKNVWIGMNVTVSPGTIIGEGAIVGLGTNVSGKIPELAIIGNERPRILKFRNPDHYYNLDRNLKYAREDGKPLN